MQTTEVVITLVKVAPIAMLLTTRRLPLMMTAHVFSLVALIQQESTTAQLL
jgi:hypothetical protein